MLEIAVHRREVVAKIVRERRDHGNIVRTLHPFRNEDFVFGAVLKRLCHSALLSRPGCSCLNAWLQEQRRLSRAAAR